jgi:hypothetical protein
MNGEQQVAARRRRTRAEVRQLVSEFVSNCMRRSEFCQSRGLSFSTLDRHLKKRRWKRKKRSAPADGQLVPVELAIRKSPAEREPSCGLAVVLLGGRRIEVQRDFDAHTFERLVSVLERNADRHLQHHGGGQQRLSHAQHHFCSRCAVADKTGRALAWPPFSSSRSGCALLSLWGSLRDRCRP